MCWMVVVPSEALRTLQFYPSRSKVGIVSSAVRSGLGDNDGVGGGVLGGVLDGVSLLLLPNTGCSRRGTWRVSGVNHSISSVDGGV
jgi:hypothetical protein